MLARIRLLLGISLLWLALSMIFDGINSLVLPNQIAQVASQENRATVLGLLTFTGLLAGMLVQPVAGALSDRFRARTGRLGFIGLGVALVLISLFLLAGLNGLAGAALGYLAVQVTLSIVQAGQQGLIPDLAPQRNRGIAAGLKGFMDIAGAMLGFILLGKMLGSGQTRPALVIVAGVLLAGYLLTVVFVPEARSASPVHPAAGKRFSVGQAFQLDFRQHADFARLVLARFLFLLATYVVGRFLLYFVAERLELNPDQAAEQAGGLLAGLALITVLAALPAGWAADRFGRRPLMIAGSVLSALGVLLLAWSDSPAEMLLYGALMSAGSAAFAGANWAMTADLAPQDEAGRFFGLANFGTAGAAAAAGLFGPLVDWTNRISPGSGYPAVFILAALVFVASVLPLRNLPDPYHSERKVPAEVRPVEDRSTMEVRDAK